MIESTYMAYLTPELQFLESDSHEGETPICLNWNPKRWTEALKPCQFFLSLVM